VGGSVGQGALLTWRTAVPPLPQVSSEGHVLGSLGIMDIKPRSFPAGACGGVVGFQPPSPRRGGLGREGGACCPAPPPPPLAPPPLHCNSAPPSVALPAGALNVICNFAELVVREMERSKATAARAVAGDKGRKRAGAAAWAGCWVLGAGEPPVARAF
jgi:hypothetical protein